MVEVQGAYHLNGVDGGFHVQVKFRCPHCRRRPTQVVETIAVPEYVDATCKCGREYRVMPYRSLLKQEEKSGSA